MAEMRPPIFPHPKTGNQAERKVFEQLERNLPDDGIVLYEPILYTNDQHPRRPDFLLFYKTFGCVVMEVKNWGVESLQSGDAHYVWLKNGKGRTCKKNPFKQATEYMLRLSWKWTELPLR